MGGKESKQFPLSQEEALKRGNYDLIFACIFHESHLVVKNHFCKVGRESQTAGVY